MEAVTDRNERGGRVEPKVEETREVQDDADALDGRVKAVLERHQVTSLLRSLKMAELELLLQIMRSNKGDRRARTGPATASTSED